MIDDDALNNIEKLHKLKADGIITQEDFDKAKADLLSGSKPRSSRMPVAAPAAEIPLTGLPAEDDFFGWVFLPLRRFADFKGRSTRKEFWMFHLLYVAVVLGAGVLSIGGADTGLALLLLALLALVVPLIAVQVRRFHDLNKSGWLALLNLVPYLGVLILYVMMLFDGTPGENSYGPDPKGRE